LPQPHTHLRKFRLALTDNLTGKLLTMSIERNAPCPCGSGKKYKKCCWLKAQSTSNTLVLSRLVERMSEWAATRFRQRAKQSMMELMQAYSEEQFHAVLSAIAEGEYSPSELSIDYFFYGYCHEYRDEIGTTIQHFLAHCGAMAREERAFFERLEKSRLRAYEVLSVAADSVEIVDAITPGAPFRVFGEITNIEAQDTIIARIVELNGRLELVLVLFVSTFYSGDIEAACTRALNENPVYLALNSIENNQPIDGEAHENELARELAAKMIEAPELQGAMSEQLVQLKGTILELELYYLWLDDYLYELDEDTAPRSFFAGTGEPVELYEDDYDVLDHPALLQILRAQVDIEMPKAEQPTCVTRAELVNGIIPPMGRPRTTINFDGVHKLSLFHPTKDLHAQGKAWFELIAGNTVRFRQTRMTDPMKNLTSGANVSAIGGHSANKSDTEQAALMQNPEMQTAVKNLVRKQYATWADDQIPILDYQTPRQLIANKAGRERVRALLISYEQNPVAGMTIDYQFLWDELGLARKE
jgi:hypothetical protein